MAVFLLGPVLVLVTFIVFRLFVVHNSAGEIVNEGCTLAHCPKLFNAVNHSAQKIRQVIDLLIFRAIILVI
jgi:hypothetical protein